MSKQQVKCKPDKVRRKLNAGELSGIKHRNKWYVRKSELWNFPYDGRYGGVEK